MKKLLAVCTTALQAVGLARGGNSTPRHAHNRLRITKRPAIRKVVGASLAAVLSVGMIGAAVVVPSAAANDNSDWNHASSWEPLYPGSSCYKMESGFSGSSYLLPVLGSNETYVAVVVNAGSDQSTDGHANNIFDATHNTMPAPGVTVTSYDGKGISHIIICTLTVTPPSVRDAVASVSVTPATCTAPATLVWGATTFASLSGTANGTTGPGAYSVTATANTNHLFADGTPTQLFTGTLAAQLSSTDPYCATSVSDAVASVSVTPATCTAPATLVWGATTFASLSGTADGTTGPGAYSVMATANVNHLFADGTPTQLFTGTLAAQLSPTDPSCVTLVTLATDPEVAPQTCVNEATLTSGYITVAVTDHVTYSIVGTSAGSTVNIADASAKTLLVPGNYLVTATADPGFVLSENDGPTWNLTVSAYDGVCEQITTHAFLPSAVSYTNQVCSAGVATGGSITVAQIDGNQFGKGLSYFIDGVKVTSVTTAKAPGTYHVTATVDNPQDTIDGESSWTITVAAPSTDCAQLKTLAFTGADGSMGGMLIFALFLLLGGAGVYTASRLRSRES
jgi:hypothetical protein